MYRTNKRLERVVGILAVVAVRILQMRTVARVDPERPARKVAPKRWVHLPVRHPKTTASQSYPRMGSKKDDNTRFHARGRHARRIPCSKV